MGQFLLVTLRALDESGRGCFIVRSAFSAARFRVASFRIWHCNLPSVAKVFENEWSILLNVFQDSPTRIHLVLMTQTDRSVHVDAADRT